MRDLRLALPVALAWATLAALSPHAALLGVGAVSTAVIAFACLALAWAVQRSRPAGWVGPALRTVAVGAGLACPLLLAAEAVTVEPLERCAEVSLLLLGEAAPTEVLVTGCTVDDHEIGMVRSAMLLRAADVPLAIGATAAGACDAWIDGTRWLLACAELEVGAAEAWAGWASPLRDGLLGAAEQLPGLGSELLPGLAIGDERGVSVALRGAMLESGLSHLTAVSGANCVIVVGAAFQTAAACGAPRSVRVVVAAAALAAFVVLVTPEPSVVRASAMASIGLLGVATGRRAGAVALLALAVLAVLLLQPQLATSAGFALSALATCGLIVHARPLATMLSRWLPVQLAAIVAVPLAAQLWCTPVLVGLDASISLVSVLANLLAGPAAPLVTVVGLVACLAAPLAPAVAVGLAWIAWVPAGWIAHVATVASQLPAATIPWPAAPWGVIAAGAMLGAVALAHARGQLVRGVLAAATIAVLAGVTAAWPSIRLGSLADWTIAQCDVGQGSATLVRYDDSAVLVDAGEDPARLQTCLRMLGVQQVDLFVLTHFDVDHSGGASALEGRTALLVHGPLDDRAQPVVDAAVASGAHAHEARRGDAWQVGGIRVDALWPVGTPEPGNDASVVVAIDLPGGALDLVVLGDLGAATQAQLLRAGVPQATSVVVAHHGSADQLPALYRRIGASVALVGVGENDYGHPTDAALQIAREAGGVVFRTDEHGVVAVRVSDEGVSAWTERGG